MTVVDLSEVQTEEKAVIDYAIRTLAQGGEIKLDIPHRISRVYGRQLSIAGQDGSHSSIAVFYYQKRLYQIQGLALPSGEDATAEAIRFQQSLVFTNNAANRTLLEPVFQVVGRLSAATAEFAGVPGFPALDQITNSARANACSARRRAIFSPTHTHSRTEPLITANGFREYDARWLYPKEINLIGMQALGLALGSLFPRARHRAQEWSWGTITAPIRSPSSRP